MSDLTDLLDQAEAREERASDMVARICAGERWTMRVPVDEARDSDTVIAASLADVPRLTAALRAVSDLADEMSDEDAYAVRFFAHRIGNTITAALTPAEASS